MEKDDNNKNDMEQDAKDTAAWRRFTKDMHSFYEMNHLSALEVASDDESTSKVSESVDLTTVNDAEKRRKHKATQRILQRRKLEGKKLKEQRQRREEKKKQALSRGTDYPRCLSMSSKNTKRAGLTTLTP